MKKLIILAISILLSACVSTLPENTHFEPEPKIEIKTVKKLFKFSLKDPDSAQYELGSPKKGYLNDAPIAGGSVNWHGWYTEVLINSKNSYGGYTGYKKYVVFYDNGEWKLKYHLGTLITWVNPVK